MISANGGEILHFEESNALVYEEGLILHVPPVSLEALCDLDLRYWPYDTQSCSFKFGSWSHGGDRIELELFANQSEVSLNKLVTERYI